MRILCTICADLVNPTENLHATNCGHLFHHHCLTEWIERSNTCPQCRRIVGHSCIFRVFPTISDETPQEIAVLQAKLDEATRALHISNENEELLKVYTLELDNRNNELESLKLKLESEQASLQQCTDLNEELKKNVTFLTRVKKLADIKNNELSHKLEIQRLDTTRLRDENEVLKKNLQILKKTLYKAEFEKNELRKKLYTADQACMADKIKALSQRLKMGQLSQKNLVRTLARLHAILLASQQTNNNIHTDDIVEKLSKMLSEGIVLGPKLTENNNNTYDELAKESSNKTNGIQIPQNASSSSSDELKEQTSKMPNRTVFENSTEIAFNELVKKLTSEIVPNGAKPKTSEKCNISRDKPEKPFCESSNIVYGINEPTKEISSETSTAFPFASTSNQSINDGPGLHFSQRPSSSSSDEQIKEQTSKITSDATIFEKSQSENASNSPPFEDEGLLLSSLFSKGLIMGPQPLPSEGSSNGHLEPCSISERLLSEPKSQSENLRDNRSEYDEQSTVFQKDKKFIFGVTLSETSSNQKFTFPSGVLGGSKSQSENTNKIAINELATTSKSGIVPNGAKPNTSEKLDSNRDKPEKPLYELSNTPRKQPTKEISNKISPAFVFASTSKQSTASSVDLREDLVKQRMKEGSSTNVFASTSCDILNGPREFIPKSNPLRSKSLSRKPSNVTRDRTDKKPVLGKSKGYNFEMKPQQTKFSFGSKPQYPDNPSNDVVTNRVESGVLAESPTELSKEIEHRNKLKNSISQIAKEELSESTSKQRENGRDYHYEEFVKSLKKITWPRTFVSERPSEISSRYTVSSQIASRRRIKIRRPIFKLFLKRFLLLKPQLQIKNNSACMIKGDEILSEKLKQFFESKLRNHRNDDETQVFKFESTTQSHACRIRSKETRQNKKTGQLRWSQLKQTSTLCDKEDLRRSTKKKMRKTKFFTRFPPVPFRFHPLETE